MLSARCRKMRCSRIRCDSHSQDPHTNTTAHTMKQTRLYQERCRIAATVDVTTIKTRIAKLTISSTATPLFLALVLVFFGPSGSLVERGQKIDDLLVRHAANLHIPYESGQQSVRIRAPLLSIRSCTKPVRPPPDAL